jgi:hypothetical protein
MSALLAPFGLRAVSHPSGVLKAKVYTAPWASGFATNLYQGSAVILQTGGTLTIAANAADWLGAFVGCEYTDSNGRRQYSKFWPASTSATQIVAYVYDDPLTTYEIQAEGTLAQTAIGDQANFSVAANRAVGDGTTTPGLSTTAASITLAGAGSQGMMRVLDKARYVDNDWGDTFTIIQVQNARSQYVAVKVAI